MLSVDEMGMIEYWSGSKNNFEFPTNVDWEFKTDTDLYEFVKVFLFTFWLLIEYFLAKATTKDNSYESERTFFCNVRS